MNKCGAYDTGALVGCVNCGNCRKDEELDYDDESESDMSRAERYEEETINNLL